MKPGDKSHCTFCERTLMSLLSTAQVIQAFEPCKQPGLLNRLTGNTRHRVQKKLVVRNQN